MLEIKPSPEQFVFATCGACGREESILPAKSEHLGAEGSASTKGWFSFGKGASSLHLCRGCVRALFVAYGVPFPG